MRSTESTLFVWLAALATCCALTACDDTGERADDDSSTDTGDVMIDADEEVDDDVVTDDVGDLDELDAEADVSVDVEPSDLQIDELEPIPWGSGDLQVSGRAYFFDMETLGQIEWVTEVDGAVVYLIEAPEIQATLDSADDHVFTLEGIPRDVAVTLALTAPDFLPHMTATLPVGDQSLEGVTFQVVSSRIGHLVSTLLGVDGTDPTICQMATTVTAAGGDSIWAGGEPGATVTIEPAVPTRRGPFYFNTDVMPDRTLTETTTDGGVVVAGVEPSLYTWRGHKDGVTFSELEMRCVGGWVTNASPPFGMNVVVEE